MATTLGEVSVTLLMKIEQFITNQKAAKDAIAQTERAAVQANERMGSSFKSLFAGLGIGLSAFVILKKGIIDSVRAYIEAEDANKRLLAAVDGNVQKFKELETQADRLQQLTIFGDEEIKNAQTYLALQDRTQDQIKKTIEAAVDYSAVTGKDLPTAVKELNMTYEENIGRLGRLDKRFKDLTPEQLRNGAAIDLIKEKYNGFGEVIGNTVEGKVRKFQNAMDELKEGYGQGFVETLAEDFDNLSTSITTTAFESKDLAKALGAATSPIKLLESTLGFATVIIDGFLISVKKLISDFGVLARAGSDVLDSMRNMTAGIPIIGNFFAKIISKAQEYYDKLLNIIAAQDSLREGKALDDSKYTDDGRRINTKDPMNDPANRSNRDNSPGSKGKTSALKEEKKELDEIERRQEEINKLEAEHLELIKKYDVNSKFIQDHTKKIKQLKAELKELLEVEKERAREYEKNSRAEGTREMADGSSRPGARPEASLLPDENAWANYWIMGINYATQIADILNRRPENLFQTFLQLLQIALQIANSFNKQGGGDDNPFMAIFSAGLGLIGKIFGFAGGGKLSEGKISGPGTSTSDSILAMAGNRFIRLSNEEYIVPKWMNFLYPFLEGIRTGKSGLSTRDSFASGGRLSGGSSAVFRAGNIIIQEEGVISESIARKIVFLGTPGYNIMKKKRGLRS